MKVIKSLKNRGNLLKCTTRKVTNQRGFFNFLRPLMIARLPLIKNVITPLGKSVLILLGLTAAASATYAVVQ